MNFCISQCVLDTLPYRTVPVEFEPAMDCDGCAALGMNDGSDLYGAWREL